MSTEEGMIFNIQDYSIHDGDGVRTMIFMLGCPLRCEWCANPESQKPVRKLLYQRHRCIECKKCETVCPEGLSPYKMERPNPKCTLCGACVDSCPGKALSITGEKVTADEVIKRVERDALFFRFTGGGVTFSGGEPFYQSEFLKSMADGFFNLGIGMWAETSGYFDFEKNLETLRKLDHVYIDLKIFDEKEHIRYTGVSNSKILSNIIKINKEGIPMTIRIPSMSDVNLNEKNIRETALFIRNNLKNVDVELLPYHKLGKDKFISMGNPATDFIEFRTPTPEELDNAVMLFREMGIEAKWI